ncbi:MAG: metalloregulator ArsR/SmtB family transcription factor [Candidatus Marinimicrobia bacterium]|nr:metalloregulator ArsR/SmtB family transcription factor [Candidatus Neomarinimicrobiota bacterium]
MQNMRIDYQKEADILKALANPIRLKIVDAVKDGEVCVGNLAKMTGASQSCVSQHLSILRNIGLVKTYRDGNLVCYTLNHDLTEKILTCIYEQYDH